MSTILHGDCLDRLKEMEDNSIDLVCTDPPYGYSFMGKNWDSAVPTAWLWSECLRVLKPGAFAFVMSAPRSDVQMHMIQNLTEAGFRLDFTPIYWTYASGFPKAGDVAKLVDRRLGAEREVVSSYERSGRSGGILGKETTVTRNIDLPSSDQAKALDGSYTGFQPKPAVEVIIVAMKPLSEKTYVDQALKNGKGITWLDDCRIPADTDTSRPQGSMPQPTDWQNRGVTRTGGGAGRFPANLLVSDDVLNDGTITKSNVRKGKIGNIKGGNYSNTQGHLEGSDDYIGGVADSGSYSRYFDLDKWASTLPFLIDELNSKAYNREKNTRGTQWETKEAEERRGSVNKSSNVNNAEPSLRTGQATEQNNGTFAPRAVTLSLDSQNQSLLVASAGTKHGSTETSTAPKSVATKLDTETLDETSTTSASESITATQHNKLIENNQSDVKDARNLSHTLNDIIQICQNLQTSFGSVSPATGELKQQELETDPLSKLLEQLPENVQKTYPFLVCAKASKSEKNKGLASSDLPLKQSNSNYGSGGFSRPTEQPERVIAPSKNHHPTVKPLKLMSYLITLGSRPGDTVLDPFCGSGTTILAAEKLDRIGIGIEREAEYVEIAEARLKHLKDEPKQMEFV